MLRWTAYCWGSFQPAAVVTSNLLHEKPVSSERASTHAPTQRATSAQGPYQHLAEEILRRLADLREAGTVSDPRELQITRDHVRSAQRAVNGIAALATHPALHVACPLVSRCWLPVRWPTESGSELRGSGSGSGSVRS